LPTPAFAGAGAAFLRVDDWERAQTLANGLSPDVLRRVLDRGACPRAGQRPDPWAQQCCPVLDVFAQSYHWSFMQLEYATDLVFRSPTILKPLYQQLSRQAILTVKAEHVATFLGTGSLLNSRKRSAVNSQRGSRGPASASFRQILDQDL